jgi:hypothetical protein
MVNLEDEAIDGRARSIEVNFKNNFEGRLEFQVESDSIVTYEFQLRNIADPFLEFPGTVLYLLSHEALQYLQRFNFNTNQELYKQTFSYNPHIISSVYMYLSNSIIPLISDESSDNNYGAIFNVDSKSNYKKTLFLNQQGKPFRGTLVELQNEENTFRCTHFEESKGTVLSDKIDFDELLNQLNS